MIKAIIFDLGGVILNLDLKKSIEAYETRIGFHKAEEMLDACHQKGLFMELEAGIINKEEFLSEAKKYCNPGTTDEELIECQCLLVGDIDSYKVEYIQKLSERYPLYILSNNNPITMPACAEAFSKAGIAIAKYFKDTFVSSEMKMMKPGKEIYLETIRRIGLKPEELLFIDDSPANKAAAESVGMKAIHYIPGTNLAEQIEKALL